MSLDRIIDKIKGLFKESAETTADPNLRLCIRVVQNTLVSFAIHKIGNKFSFLSSDTHQFDTFENIPYILSGIAKKANLNDANVYWLLSPDDYQLFLIESLPVEANELKDALMWRVRTLINYPIDEAVIDHFNFPAKKLTIQTNMVAAVTAHKEQLKKIAECVKKSNLKLNFIDIAETALRNLSAEYEDDEKSTAFIYFFDSAIILNITLKKTLYFTRRIPMQMTQDRSFDYEKISLEILRYFDYFQSQWRNAPPNRIFIGAENESAAQIAKGLSEYLMLPTEVYRFENLFVDQKNEIPAEPKYLLNVGCLLRGISE